MAVNCVEEPREGEAEDGAQEEHADHHLLLDRRHKRHVGPEHVHQTQTEEEQTACRGKRRNTINNHELRICYKLVRMSLVGEDI